MNTFSESVLRGMTDEELLKEQPSELLCKILMERIDRLLIELLLNGPEELEGLLGEIKTLLENANEPLKRTAKPYRKLINDLEKLHNAYS